MAEHHPRYPALIAQQPIVAEDNRTTTIVSPMAYGYWVNPMPFHLDSKYPDIISYGLGIAGGPSTIGYFTNPLNNESVTKHWAINPIQSFTYAVGMGYGDFRGPDVNLNDIVICDRHGPTIWGLLDEEKDDGGRILYMRNPGKRMGVPFWETTKIGNITGMHRLQIGRFTREDVNQVLAAPVIAASGNLDLGVPLPLYDPVYGEKISDGPVSWNRTVTNADYHVIHDIQVVPRYNNGLDTLLFAAREGIVHLYYDLANQAWNTVILGQGMPQELGTPQFWGSMTVDYARVGDDPCGYIVSCEAYHGNTVAVYVKSPDAPKGYASFLDGRYWTRFVVDSFGPVHDVLQTGTIHHIRRIPLAGDVEPFSVACVGEPIGRSQNQGVYMFRPVDLASGKFEKIRIHGESSARMAIGEFTELGQVDVASVSYYVPGYHTGPDPAQIRLSRIGPMHIA